MTAEILTQARLKELVAYDPETGIMTRAGGRSSRRKIGEEIGYLNSHLGYRMTILDGKLRYVHRLAWLYMTGEDPVEIDHIDGIRANNRWKNLRDVTHQANLQNVKRAFRTSGTGVLGASEMDGGRYRASISVNNKSRHLGCFDTAEEANATYLKAKRQLHEGNML